MDAFTQKVYAIFGKLYQQEQGAQGAQPDMGGVNPDGSVNGDGSVN